MLTHLQVLSGLLPFHHLRFPIVVCAILRGERPSKPLNASSLGFTDSLWGLLQLCWSKSALVRPTARQLYDHLRSASLAWVPPPMVYSTAGDGGGGVLSSDWPGVSGASLSGPVCRIQ
jgi:hypothetical protein